MEEIFKENNIDTVKDLFEIMHNFMFGWLDSKKEKHYGANNSSEYRLQFPEDTFKYKIGVCWDMTELARAFFEIKQIEHKTYFLFYDDGEQPSHSILVFKNQDKFYWFEPMFNTNDKYDKSGIHEYNSLNELLYNFKKVFLDYSLRNNIIPKSYDHTKLYCFEYEKPHYEITGKDWYKHCQNGKKMVIFF